MTTNEGKKLRDRGERKPRGGHHGYIVDIARLTGDIVIIPVIVPKRSCRPANGRGFFFVPALYHVYIEEIPEGMSKFAERFRYTSEDQIFFDPPKIVDQQPEGIFWKWSRHDGSAYVACDPALMLAHALEAPDTGGKWWASSRGALERPATMYEARFPVPPTEGWHLVDGAAHSAKLKQLPALSSELDDQERAEKIARVQKNLEAAQAMIAKHKRRQALQTTLVAKWQKKAQKIEKKLAAMNVPKSED